MNARDGFVFLFVTMRKRQTDKSGQYSLAFMKRGRMESVFEPGSRIFQ